MKEFWHKTGKWIFCVFLSTFPLAFSPSFVHFTLVKYSYLKFLGAAAVAALAGATWPARGEKIRGFPLMLIPAMTAALYFLAFYGLNSDTIIFFLAGMVLAGLLYHRARRGFYPADALNLGFTFIGLGCLWIIFSDYTMAAVNAFYGHHYQHTGLMTVIFCMVFLCLPLICLKTEDDIQHGINALLLGGVPVAAIGVLQYLGLNLLPRGTWYFDNLFRSYSTMGNPNWFATYLLFLLPLALYKFLRGNSKIWLLLSALIFASLLATLSRGAWVALACLSICTLICFRKHYVKLALACGLCIAVVLSLLPLHNWMLLKRMASISRESDLAVRGKVEARIPGRGYLYSTGERIAMWKWMLKVLPKYWFKGAGLDSLPYIQGAGKAPSIKAHNIYLDLAVTMGIPGLIAYLALLFRCLFLAKGERCFVLTMRLLLLAYLAQGAFIYDKVSTWPLLWSIMGISLAMEMVQSPSKKALEEPVHEGCGS
ncbi:MAG: O-antigen ligase family protein [Bacillota bacterium]